MIYLCLKFLELNQKLKTMFAIIWIVIWALIFNIFNGPSVGQIIGFILIGLGGPIGRWLFQISKG